MQKVAAKELKEKGSKLIFSLEYLNLVLPNTWSYAKTFSQCDGQILPKNNKIQI